MAKLIVAPQNVRLVRDQLKTIARRFRRYERREPHEETVCFTGPDADVEHHLVDDSEKWRAQAEVFEGLVAQLTAHL